MISRTLERLKKIFTNAQTFWASEKFLALVRKTFWQLGNLYAA
jgi:hypothetical protein